MAYNIALELNPSRLVLDLDSKNAHTFCSRAKLEEELELNVAFHYMLESFRALYGKTVTVQWHFGNGPERPSTSFHLSCEGLRQGDAPTTVYFNVLEARVYKKQLVLLNGTRGVLFATAGDVKILAPPVVIKELAKSFPTIAWEEAGLTTQIVKNRIFVHQSARAKWRHFLDSAPRNSLAELPVHDIPDGSERVDPFDPNNEKIWPDEDEVNILGTTLLGPNFLSPHTYRAKDSNTVSCYNIFKTWPPRASRGKPNIC